MTGRYEEIVKQVAAVKEQRGKMYRTEPKDIVPIEILEAVALLKAYRGYEGIDIDKKIDEYTDLMNYSAFIIERLQDLKTSKPVPTPVLDATSSVQVMKVIPGSKPGLLKAVPDCFGKYDMTRKECVTGCPSFSSCIYEKSMNKKPEKFPFCFGKQTPDCVKIACNAYEDCKMRTREILCENTSLEVVKKGKCDCRDDTFHVCPCDCDKHLPKDPLDNEGH